MKHTIITLFFVILSGNSSYAISHNPATLLSYTGYITTPSAYISDARLSFSYSYFSKSFPLNDNIAGKNSEIWNFSSCIGFFPFLEFILSGYVLPSTNISDKIPNYGADKWRSAGIKIKILNEKKLFPACAVGLIDPDVSEFGAKISSPNLPSSYIVLSKNSGKNKSSISLGYGFDYLTSSESYRRLRELFGGFNLEINDNFSLLCDYDGKMWNGGFNINWRKISIMFSFTEGAFLASRIGYGVDLLKH